MSTTQDTQVGVVAETTYGSAVTVTRFYEPVSVTPKWKPNTVQGKGLRAGTVVARSGRRVRPTSEGEVELEVECGTRGQGLLWQAALGYGVNTNRSGSIYQELFRPLTAASTSTPLTVQVGVPQVDGTVNPHTFAGCTVSSWEFSAPNGDIATLKLTMDARSVTQATGLASKSFTSGVNLFHFGQVTTGGITLAGAVTAPTTTALASGGTAVANVRSFSLKGSNNLAVDRFNFGASGLKAQPTWGLREYTGEMEIEYDATTVSTAFLADTELALTLTFTSSEDISGGTYAALQITIPALKLDGDLPTPNGNDLVTTSIPFTVLDNLTAAYPLYVALVTADTAL